MKGIYTIKNRTTGKLMTDMDFDTKDQAKVVRNMLNKEAHGDEKYLTLTVNGVARYCVVKSHTHPKEVSNGS